MELIHNVTHYRDLSKSKFIAGTKLFSDELLSSWLVRCAYNHLTVPTSFTNMHFPEYAKNIIWQRDLDIWAPHPLLERLLFKSGIPINDLNFATLRSFNGILGEQIYDKSRFSFISALGNYCHVKKLGGLKFCPLCWSEDLQPYIRKNWRLSFYSVCVKHNILMHNRCHNCKSPLTIYRTKDGFGVTHCFKCGVDLMDSNNESIPQESYGLCAINKLLNIIENKVFWFEGTEIKAIDFFRGLRQLNKLIYLWGYRQNVFEHEIMRNIEFAKNKSHIAFYESYMPLYDIYLLYSASMQTLSCRENVRNFIEINKIKPYALMKDAHDVFWAP